MRTLLRATLRNLEFLGKDNLPQNKLSVPPNNFLYCFFIMILIFVKGAYVPTRENSNSYDGQEIMC